MLDEPPRAKQIDQHGAQADRFISQRRALGPLSSRMSGVILLLAIVACQCKGMRNRPVVDFRIDVLDSRDQPLPCRIHLRDRDGNRWTSPTWPAFNDHFVYSGSATFRLQTGRYKYEIERGPEYRSLAGRSKCSAPEKEYCGSSSNA